MLKRHSSNVELRDSGLGSTTTFFPHQGSSNEEGHYMGSNPRPAL